MNALDPHDCTRCRRPIAADEPTRPEYVSSKVFAPADPRPTMPGGSRADGTVAGPSEVWWEIEADYERPGGIAALLCQACLRALSDWLYDPAARITSSRAVSARSTA